MSTLAQSVLMAVTVTVNKFASSNVQAVRKRRTKKPNQKTPDIVGTRRGLILSAIAAAPPLNDSAAQLLQKYLKKSEENKAKNDKERTESYYKRNYKDYFEFEEGSLKGKTEQQLTEAEKGILDWLKNNR